MKPKGQRQLNLSNLRAINCQGDTVELSLSEDDVERLTHSLERGLDPLKNAPTDALKNNLTAIIKRET